MPPESRPTPPERQTSEGRASERQDSEPRRVSDLLGRTVRDADGRELGRIADLVTERRPDGREEVVAAIVTTGRWGRLLGYERSEVVGPWLIEQFARRVLRRHTTRVAWAELRW